MRIGIIRIGKEIGCFIIKMNTSFYFANSSVGVTKEQARELEKNGEQYICPSCRGIVIFYDKNINRMCSRETTCLLLA